MRYWMARMRMRKHERLRLRLRSKHQQSGSGSECTLGPGLLVRGTTLKPEDGRMTEPTVQGRARSSSAHCDWVALMQVKT
jgi:hypothetical protein